MLLLLLLRTRTALFHILVRIRPVPRLADNVMCDCGMYGETQLRCNVPRTRIA